MPPAVLGAVAIKGLWFASSGESLLTKGHWFTECKLLHYH